MSRGQRVRGNRAVAESEHVYLFRGLVANDCVSVLRKQRVGKRLRPQLGLPVSPSGDRYYPAVLAHFLNQLAKLFDIPIQAAMKQHQRSSTTPIDFVIDLRVVYL